MRLVPRYFRKQVEEDSRAIGSEAFTLYPALLIQVLQYLIIVERPPVMTPPTLALADSSECLIVHVGGGFGGLEMVP